MSWKRREVQNNREKTAKTFCVHRTLQRIRVSCNNAHVRCKRRPCGQTKKETAEPQPHHIARRILDVKAALTCCCSRTGPRTTKDANSSQGEARPKASKYRSSIRRLNYTRTHQTRVHAANCPQRTCKRVRSTSVKMSGLSAS